MHEQDMLKFDAQRTQTRRTQQPLMFVWMHAETHADAITRYDGVRITHSEPDATGAYESTVTHVTAYSEPPPRIVAYRVGMRGDEEVLRLPYTQMMLDARAALGDDVPTMERAA